MNFIGFDKSKTGVRKVGVEETTIASQAIVLFLLDESGSMSGEKIQSLNDAINRFPMDVAASNRIAQKNIEIAIIAFSSSVRLVSDWTPLGSYSPVSLSAQGGTDLGVALDAAIKKVKEKLNRCSGAMAHIVLISDGFGGSVTNAAVEIAKMKQEGNLVFWMLGVPGYDSRTAQELTGGEHLYLLKSGKQFDYTDFISILSSTVVKMQNQNQSPKLKSIPEVKKISFK